MLATIRTMLATGVLLTLAGPVAAQFVIEETLQMTGKVESVSPSTLVLKDDSGKPHTIRVQAPGQRGVQLSGGGLLNFPAEIRVQGTYSPDELTPGQSIRFRGRVRRAGKTEGAIKAISLVSGDDKANQLRVMEQPQGAGDSALCEIIGTFTGLKRGNLVVKIPPDNGFTRKPALSFEVAEDAVVDFASDELRRAAAGAEVKRLVAVRLNTGDLLAKSIEIELTGTTTARGSVDEALLEKYRHLSDEPRKPRLVRSQHFAFLTDVSDRQARIILDKLETMAGLLSHYFGRAPRGVVEGYIVQNLDVWPEGVLEEPQGIAKIRNQAGVCFCSSLGSKRRAILYSCDDHGVIQHECTHGFCHLAFGSTGPTWLAEGLAEMGQYWKADQLAVDVGPIVINYLQRTSPKKTLTQIAVPGDTDAGTWRDYAWRWALCHLLAYNPNYANRFKPLAIALMEEQEGVSFAAVYGPVAKQISFEYDLFLQTLDNGYRADLCAWQWGAKFAPLAGNRRTKQRIIAAYGWQASGITLEEGVSYDIAAVGTWKIAQDDSEYTADGDDNGRGQLMGVIFSDFALSKPFPIGKLQRFTAPADGQLFLRCRDDWNKLEDNSGDLTVHFRRTPEEDAGTP